MEQFAGNVIDYFEDTYIGRLRPGGHRRAPLFDLALWNMYEQTIGDLPRTNNAVEGWHRRNGFFKNHQTTGFMPPKTVLLRTTNLP